METSKYLTKALIPTNGVWITENRYPTGFYVAKYDADGLTEGNRFASTLESAHTYAEKLAS